jgi:hypothetical protein
MTRLFAQADFQIEERNLVFLRYQQWLCPPNTQDSRHRDNWGCENA